LFLVVLIFLPNFSLTVPIKVVLVKKSVFQFPIISHDLVISSIFCFGKASMLYAKVLV